MSENPDKVTYCPPAHAADYSPLEFGNREKYDTDPTVCAIHGLPKEPFCLDCEEIREGASTWRSQYYKYTTPRGKASYERDDE